MDRTPMASKDLDDFFGTPADRVASAVANVSQAVTAGNYDPREFYAYSNKATQHLTDLWSRWTGVPNRGGAKQNQFKCCAKLLTEYPDVDLIEQAVNKLTRLGRISHGIDMYHMRILVINECAKIKHNNDKRLILQDDMFGGDCEDDELTPCPRCGAVIHPSQHDMDCKWHGGSYAEDVAMEDKHG